MTRKRLAITLVELLVIIAIVGVLFALLLPATRNAREPARRNACINNLKNITIALLQYVDENGALPPAYTVDADGNRLHSWRTLILPYLEQGQLYESIDLSKPWDDPVNAKARETVVEMYLCPSSPDENNLTNYLGVVGPGCAFSGSVPRELSEVTDDLSNTVVVLEVESDKAVHWMSPNDINEGGAKKFSDLELKTNHPGVSNAAFLDGRAHSIEQDIEPETLRAMLTIAGGETIGD